MRSVLIRSLFLTSFCCAMACSHGLDLRRASSQVRAGAEAARMSLWREAMFRFQKAVKMNPADALALNDLAVAYESNGEFDKARETYIEALKLDKSNQYIQKNYSRFVEFETRNRKRDASAAASAIDSQRDSAPGSRAPAPTPEAIPPQPLPHPDPPSPPVTPRPPAPSQRGEIR